MDNLQIRYCELEVFSPRLIKNLLSQERISSLFRLFLLKNVTIKKVTTAKNFSRKLLCSSELRKIRKIESLKRFCENQRYCKRKT